MHGIILFMIECKHFAMPIGTSSAIQVSNIRHLTIGIPSEDRFSSFIPTLDRLIPLNFSLDQDFSYLQLQLLLDRAPRLRTLRVCHSTSTAHQFVDESSSRSSYWIHDIWTLQNVLHWLSRVLLLNVKFSWLIWKIEQMYYNWFRQCPISEHWVFDARSIKIHMTHSQFIYGCIEHHQIHFDERNEYNARCTKCFVYRKKRIRMIMSITCSDWCSTTTV